MARTEKVATGKAGILRSKMRRKREGRTTVAHISDLHLKAGTDTSKEPWDALKEALAYHQDDIDLLIVTGDLVELPSWPKSPRSVFEDARDYLLALCQECALRPESGLLVLPGNHDVRYLRGTALFHRKARENFSEVFGDYMPSHRLYSRLELCFFLFDSNARKEVDLAAGFVQPKDLTRMKREARQIRIGYPDDWSQATRIALLHHHPMPIGPTQRLENQLLGGEPYMLLKNSGVFMREVVRADVELVLHGHRHYPAISRVQLEIEEGRERAVTVLAAGSVGQDEDHDLSYNMLTFKDSGEVALQRFDRPEYTYESVLKKSLIDYPQARKRRIPRLARLKPSALKAREFRWHCDIEAGSGNSTVTWALMGATARGDETVGAIPRPFLSRTAYFGKPQYNSTRVSFIDGEETYSPPIADEPFSFEGEAAFLNSFHFNRRDRRDATDKEIEIEAFGHSISHDYKKLVLSVSFPEGHFPRGLGVEAREVQEGPDGGGGLRVDPRESEHISPLLMKFATSRTVVLSVRDPLPSYRYSIYWHLPESEEEEAEYSQLDKLGAEEIRSQLLERVGDPVLRTALDRLRGLIESESLDVALFVYQDGKLVPVATAGEQAFVQALTNRPVRVGRTHVGQAYKWRRALASLPARSAHPASFYFDPEQDPRVLGEDRTAIFAMPLMYPFQEDGFAGLRVAVLWIGTRSRLSRLIQDLEDDGALQKYANLVAAWFRKSLLPALGLGLDPEERRLVRLHSGGS